MNHPSTSSSHPSSFHRVSHPSTSSSKLPQQSSKLRRSGGSSLSSSRELPPQPEWRPQGTSGGDVGYDARKEEWGKLRETPDALAEYRASNGTGDYGMNRKRGGSIHSVTSDQYTNYSFPSNTSNNESATSWGGSTGSPSGMGVGSLGGGKFKTDITTAVALGYINPTPPPPGGAEKRGRVSRKSSLNGMQQAPPKSNFNSSASNATGGPSSSKPLGNDAMMAYPIVGSGGEEEMMGLGLGIQKELRAGGEGLVEVDLSIGNGVGEYGYASNPVGSRPPSGGKMRSGGNGPSVQITPPEEEQPGGRRSGSSSRRRSLTSNNGNGNNSGRSSRDLTGETDRAKERRREEERDSKMDVDEKEEVRNEKKSEEDKVKLGVKVKIDKDTFVDGLVSTTVIAINSIWPNQEEERSKGEENVLPLRWFIKEVLRRSRTTCSVLQTALYYLHKSRKAIRSHLSRADEAERVLTKHAENLKRARDGFPSPPPSPQRERNGNGQSPSSTYKLPLTSEQVTELLALQHDPVLCGRRMFLASLICASKFLQDRNYSNRAWAKISGLEVGEINSNERGFLVLIEYKLHVDAAVFGNWTERLMKLAQFQSQKKPGKSPQSLDRSQSEMVHEQQTSTLPIPSVNGPPSRMSTPVKRGASDISNGTISSSTSRSTLKVAPKGMSLRSGGIQVQPPMPMPYTTSPDGERDGSYPSPSPARPQRPRTNSQSQIRPHPVAHPHSHTQPPPPQRRMSLTRTKAFVSAPTHNPTNSLPNSHPFSSLSGSSQSKSKPSPSLLMEVDSQGSASGGSGGFGNSTNGGNGVGEPWSAYGGYNPGWNGRSSGGIVAH